VSQKSHLFSVVQFVRPNNERSESHVGIRAGLAYVAELQTRCDICAKAKTQATAAMARLPQNSSFSHCLKNKTAACSSAQQQRNDPQPPKQIEFSSMTGRGGANNNNRRGNAGSQQGGGRGPGGTGPPPRGGVTNDPARRSSEDDDDDNSSDDEDDSYDDEDYYDEEEEDDEEEEGEDANANGNGDGAAVLPMQDAFRGFLMNLGSLGDPAGVDPRARGAPMPPMAMLDPSGRMFSFGIASGDASNQPPRIARPVKCPVCNKETPYASATSAGGGSVTDTRVEERCSHHARTMFVSAHCPVCMEDNVGPPMVRRSFFVV
jgi:hypothetical protein